MTALVAIAEVPVNVGAETEPAGVPALTESLETELPVNTGWEFVPVGVPADTVDVA